MSSCAGSTASAVVAGPADVLAGGVAGGGTVGAAGFLSKSTLGGVLTAASFSTVKFGFTSILNSMAVRLVGNDRTVELYTCTESIYRLRATVMRFSVPSSCDCRSRNRASDLRLG